MTFARKTSAFAFAVAASISTAAMLPSDGVAQEKPAALPEVVLGEAISIDEVRINDLLEKWEQVSRNLKPITKAKRREIERLLKPTHTGHEIDLIVSLSGPVESKLLKSHFTWKLESTTQTQTVLTAIPNEKIEKLFNQEIRITLDKKCLPNFVAFGESRVLSNSQSILLTGFQQPRRAMGRGAVALPNPEPQPVLSAPNVVQPVGFQTNEPRRLNTAGSEQPAERE